MDFRFAKDLRKFQNLNHPKNHEYDGEINEVWDNYFSGTALSYRLKQKKS